MSIEAMKLALEALETNNKAWKSLADSGDAGWWEAEEQPFYEVCVKAITALRQAIEQAQKQPDLDAICQDLQEKTWAQAMRIAELEQAQKQEPVAFPRQTGDSTWTVDTAFIWRVKHTIDPNTPNDFTPSEEQIETVLLALEKIPAGLFTSPPQRKPLTSKQIREIEVDVATNLSLDYPSPAEQFTRAIEQAHGIKGEA